MAAQERIVFTVPVPEKIWFNRLVEASGCKDKITFQRMLWDQYAKQIGFEPRLK